MHTVGNYIRSLTGQLKYGFMLYNARASTSMPVYCYVPMKAKLCEVRVIRCSLTNINNSATMEF